AAPREHARGPSPFLLALGGLVVAGGLLGVLAAAGVGVPWAVAPGAAAGAVGGGGGAGGGHPPRGRAPPGPRGLRALAAIVAGTIHLHLDDGIGNRTYVPTTTADLHRDYRLGVGNLTVDLSRLSVGPGTTRVQAHLGAGDLQVAVPHDVRVRVVGH